MKTIVILGDGMADDPVPALGNRTPLQAAFKPGMDRIARKGRTGRLVTLEPGMPTGSAVANLAVLGYDPAKTYAGRGVLEASSLGIPLSATDMTCRVNLISTADGKIASHSAGHITDAEAGELIEFLKRHFKDWNLKFHQGLSYRHVLVIPGGDPRLECAAPHDHVGESVEKLWIRPGFSEARETAEFLNRVIRESMKVLDDHPVNQKRKAEGKLPANALWPWETGIKPEMESFESRFGVTGAVVAAVDLIKGLAICAGLDVIPVKGATGLYDTNYEGKADAAVGALADHDFVFVHVEAPDEAGHEKDVALKVKTIENLDGRLVSRILDRLNADGTEAVIAVLPDHPTPVATGQHGRAPVPVAIWNPRLSADAVDRFDEASVLAGGLGLMRGDAFIRTALGLDVS
jgi:2,3-bisphosphoglycerate-independent phosphoglycerate mutase